MSSSRKEAGFITADIVVILIAAIAVGGLFAYHAIKGDEIPVWQAIAVGAVNVLAAARLFIRARKARSGGRPVQREGGADRSPR